MYRSTRLATHRECLCPAIEAGSRLSRWRRCPVHTSLHSSALPLSTASLIPHSSNPLISLLPPPPILENSESTLNEPTDSSVTETKETLESKVHDTILPDENIKSENHARCSKVWLAQEALPTELEILHTLATRIMETNSFNPFDDIAKVSDDGKPSSPEPEAIRQPLDDMMKVIIEPKLSTSSCCTQSRMQKVTKWLREMEALDVE